MRKFADEIWNADRYCKLVWVNAHTSFGCFGEHVLAIFGIFLSESYGVNSILTCTADTNPRIHRVLIGESCWSCLLCRSRRRLGLFIKLLVSTDKGWWNTDRSCLLLFGRLLCFGTPLLLTKGLSEWGRYKRAYFLLSFSGSPCCSILTSLSKGKRLTNCKAKRTRTSNLQFWENSHERGWILCEICWHGIRNSDTCSQGSYSWKIRVCMVLMLP